MNLSSPTHSCCRSLCGQALITFLLILAAGISLANDTETFFENEVRPILHNRCIECHGPEKQKAGLRLDSLASALSGGDSGPALVQSDPKSSLIIQAIHYQDPDMEMPPKQKLSDTEITVLSKWVENGAVWPGSPEISTAKRKDEGPAADIWKSAETHWSFQPVSNPPSPENTSAWGNNSIDAFILEKLESRQLKPSAKADRRSLIRRAYLDLIGLPPSSKEVDTFVADRSADAWNTVIENLLSSPHHGERWARHWMDVARLSDTKFLSFPFTALLLGNIHQAVLSKSGSFTHHSRFIFEYFPMTRRTITHCFMQRGPKWAQNEKSPEMGDS